MPPLLWDAIPLGAVLGAVAYVGWTRRPRRPAEVEDTIRSHARYREALRGAVAGSRPSSPSSDGDVEGGSR